MHAPKHANQRKGQPQQATRNGPTGDRGTLQIARTSGQLQIGRDKQCAAIDQHQQQKDADAVPRVTIAEDAQFVILQDEQGIPFAHMLVLGKANPLDVARHADIDGRQVLFDLRIVGRFARPIIHEKGNHRP